MKNAFFFVSPFFLCRTKPETNLFSTIFDLSHTRIYIEMKCTFKPQFKIKILNFSCFLNIKLENETHETNSISKSNKKNVQQNLHLINIKIDERLNKKKEEKKLNSIFRKT